MKMVDTNIVIYLMRYNPEYLKQKFSFESAKGLYISSVSLGELREGIEKSSLPQKMKRS